MTVTTLFSRLKTRLTGRRYYVVALYAAGTGTSLLSSTIHSSRAAAEAHARSIASGRSFVVAGIISFTSRLAL